MDFRNPGLSVRFTTPTMTGVVNRNGFHTNVPHLRTAEPIKYETKGPKKPPYPVLNWKRFSDHVKPDLRTGRTINITIVTWDNGNRGNTGNYAPVNYDNKEILMIAGLNSIDLRTKTYTVTNSLNQAGEGMSGGIALIEIKGNTFEIGELHGIADGKLGRTDQLRFVRSDSSDIESFYNDIETGHKKKKNGNGQAKVEKHQHGIEYDKKNEKVAELKATKSKAYKNTAKQREIRQIRKAESQNRRENRKAKGNKK